MIKRHILLLLIICLFAHPAHAIANGDPAPSLINKVFGLTQYGSSDVASSTNVVYPRCFLTAAHVADAMKVDEDEVRMGANIPEKSKSQKLHAKNIHPKYIDYPAYQPPKIRAVDLAVVWATNYTGSEEFIELSDYSPVRLVDDIGLPSSKPLVYEHGDNSGPIYEPDDQTPPGEPQRVHIFGYGFWIDTYEPAQPDPSGILRKGLMDATRYIPGANLDTNPFPGAYYRLEIVGSHAQYAIDGDSGGPVSLSADLGQGVFAVTTSSGILRICEEDEETFDLIDYNFTFATALDRSKMSEGDFQKSNWEWANEAIEKICTKSVNVSVLGPGRVIGFIDPQQRIDPKTGEQYTDQTDFGFNNSFDCGPNPSYPEYDVDDCHEAIHYGVKTTLIARPGPNARFKYWTGLSEEHCYCADSGTGNRFLNPTCVIEEQDVGVYSGSQSRDGESCTAVFENRPVSSLPGDSNGDGVVDSGDLDDVRANWGQSVEPGTQGDLSGDGIVNSSDLDIVRANWGAGV